MKLEKIMKLPEYDNRTPNTPLYSQDDDKPFESSWFVLLCFGLPASQAVCWLLFVISLFCLAK